MARPVKPYEQLSPRSQRRLRQQHRVINEYYPDYSFEQYEAERQAGEVKPTARTPYKRVPESIRRRQGGGQVFYTTEQLGEMAYQNMYNMVGPGQFAPGAFGYGAEYMRWNDQAVRYNIDVLVAENRRDDLINMATADGDAIRRNAEIAGKIMNKGQSPRSPHWFYHGDTWQTAAAQ